MRQEVLTIRGLFITLEGSDGSGKTTQAKRLKQELEARGRKCWLTREPGGTELGESIRDLLLSFKHTTMSARTEMLLYAASRAQHVDEHIRPRLNEGINVISDRFIDSSLVYQGLGLGLTIEEVWKVNLIATNGLLPDLTVVLELDALLSGQRLDQKLRANKEQRDRIESRDESFHQEVSVGYSKLKDLFPERILTIDARLSPEETTRIILQRILGFAEMAERRTDCEINHCCGAGQG